MRTATQEEADRFRDYMFAKFKGVRVPRELVSGAFQSTIGVDPTKLITANAITLGPLTWMRDGLTPDEQIETITHECWFIAKFWEKPIELAWLSLTQGEARARYAAMATVSAMEVHYARNKSLPALDTLVEQIRRGHLLSVEDTALAKGILEQDAPSIAHDTVVTEVGHAAIEWLALHAPELLAP